jgi:lipid kinase YegS
LIYIILNGKKAGYEVVHSAISTFRKETHNTIKVRVTYEYGDVDRFFKEALVDEVELVIIGGGDGSVNELINSMMKFRKEKRPKFAILPLGTANDFASSCEIPLNPLDALRFAVSNQSTSIDVVKTNDRYFINIATLGFGAHITSETPVELKNFLGGGAYALSGVLKAMDFIPYKSRIETPNMSSNFKDVTIVVGAICNGKQAGGGQILSPNAKINDGLLDVVNISEFSLIDIPQILDEIKNPSIRGDLVKYLQTPWIESHSDEIIPVNLDGEPYSSHKIRFEVVPFAVELVIDKNSPCLV